MIPTVNDDLTNDFEIEIQPSKTYAVNIDQFTVGGFVEGLSAMEQAIYKILCTERYEYLVYSWNYGVELMEQIGKSIPFVYSELQRLVTEALLQDDRITSVESFNFSSNKKSVTMKFTAITTEGEIEVEKVVSI
jgi:hypothetical protein